MNRSQYAKHNCSRFYEVGSPILACWSLSQRRYNLHWTATADNTNSRRVNIRQLFIYPFIKPIIMEREMKKISNKNTPMRKIISKEEY